MGRARKVFVQEGRSCTLAADQTDGYVLFSKHCYKTNGFPGPPLTLLIAGESIILNVASLKSKARSEGFIKLPT